MRVPRPHPVGEKPSRDVAYCAFKDDRTRLYALISRDIRYAVVAGTIALIAHEGSAVGVLQYLRGLLG